jgi:hypothetical protein
LGAIVSLVDGRGRCVLSTTEDWSALNAFARAMPTFRFMGILEVINKTAWKVPIGTLRLFDDCPLRRISAHVGFQGRSIITVIARHTSTFTHVDCTLFVEFDTLINGYMDEGVPRDEVLDAWWGLCDANVEMAHRLRLDDDCICVLRQRQQFRADPPWASKCDKSTQLFLDMVDADGARKHPRMPTIAAQHAAVLAEFPLA